MSCLTNVFKGCFGRNTQNTGNQGGNPPQAQNQPVAPQNTPQRQITYAINNTNQNNNATSIIRELKEKNTNLKEENISLKKKKSKIDNRIYDIFHSFGVNQSQFFNKDITLTLHGDSKEEIYTQNESINNNNSDELTIRRFESENRELKNKNKALNNEINNFKSKFNSAIENYKNKNQYLDKGSFPSIHGNLSKEDFIPNDQSDKNDNDVIKSKDKNPEEVFVDILSPDSIKNKDNSSVSQEDHEGYETKYL